jgi:predicted  nucleic acid-binding Zn-ribbon protein
MATRQPPDAAPPDVEAEHRALKKQILELNREHERLETEGGTRAQHQQHLRKLREKIKDLQRHLERLRGARKRHA